TLTVVLESLFRAEVRGLTISRVQGHGGETERVETYRGTTVKMDLSEKVRLEIGVSDHFVEPTVDAILWSARTGSVGDGKVFGRFVLGFPRRYLEETPRAEVVKHYALAGSLGTRPVISSLARSDTLWKLCVITRDRRFLFSRIAGALSCSGMDIVAAEAFTNASALVLDTFRFRDDDGGFEESGPRRRFQVFLEEAVEGKVELEPLLQA